MDHWEYHPARDLSLKRDEQQKSLRRENGLLYSTCHLIWWSAVKSYFKVWHRLQVCGQEHIPIKPPFIIVANHNSHLDALVLGSLFNWRLHDDIYPIAAGDVFFDSLITSLFSAGLLNALPLWRKKCGPHAMEELRQRLIEDECGYIIFPEGTRSRDGVMNSFKPGLGMLIAQSEIPVVPCYIEGSHQALPPSNKLPRPFKIKILIGKPLTFESMPNDRTGWLQIAKTLEQNVISLSKSS